MDWLLLRWQVLNVIFAVWLPHCTAKHVAGVVVVSIQVRHVGMLQATPPVPAGVHFELEFVWFPCEREFVATMKEINARIARR